MTAIRHLSDAINGLTEVQCATTVMQLYGAKKAEKSIALALEKIEIYKKGLSNDED